MTKLCAQRNTMLFFSLFERRLQQIRMIEKDQRERANNPLSNINITSQKEQQQAELQHLLVPIIQDQTKKGSFSKSKSLKRKKYYTYNPQYITNHEVYLEKKVQIQNKNLYLNQILEDNQKIPQNINIQRNKQIYDQYMSLIHRKSRLLQKSAPFQRKLEKNQNQKIKQKIALQSSNNLEIVPVAVQKRTLLFLRKKIQKIIVKLFLHYGYNIKIGKQYISQQLDSNQHRRFLGLVFKKVITKLYAIISVIKKIKIKLEDLSQKQIVKQLYVYHLWMNKKQQQTFHNFIKIMCNIGNPTIHLYEAEGLYDRIQQKIEQIKQAMTSLAPGQKYFVGNPVRSMTKEKPERVTPFQARRFQYCCRVAKAYAKFKDQSKVREVMSAKCQRFYWQLQDVHKVMKVVMKRGLFKLLKYSNQHQQKGVNELKFYEFKKEQIDTIIACDIDQSLKLKLVKAFINQDLMEEILVLESMMLIRNFLKTLKQSNKFSCQSQLITNEFD